MLPYYSIGLVVLLLALSLPANARSDLEIPSMPTEIGQTQNNRLMRQGTQIALNGRVVSIPWAQWQVSPTGGDRIGVVDYGFPQLTGAELLSTSDATRQPVQWFSQTATSLVLLTRLTPTSRYLDITDFARQAGWQSQVQGNILQITAPSARVVAARHSQQPWGDRLVLQLDRPVTWQVAQQGQELTITLNAPAEASIVQSFKPTFSKAVQGFQWNPSQAAGAGAVTELKFTLAEDQQARVWSLPQPDRLVIDVRPDAIAALDILWAPGLRYQRQMVMLGDNRFPVTWLEVNPRQPGITLKPILPNPAGVQGILPLAQTARQAQVAAAINGGFFNRNNQLPLGAVKLDGRWLSGPILGRGAIGWNPDGTVAIDRLALEETLTLASGQRFPITYLNSGYVQAGLARYTPDWGAAYTSLSDNETVLTVQNQRITNQTLLATAGSALPIPPNGYLLVLRASPSLLNAFPAGTAVQVTTATVPPNFNRFSNIVAAGPLLLRNRTVVLDAIGERFSNAFAVERASRSAIGTTPNGRLLIATVHRRIGGPGPSLPEMAQMMQQLGAVDALNLDGGSSTTLFLGGQVVDRPPRSTARVHNGIGIFVTPR